MSTKIIKFHSAMFGDLRGILLDGEAWLFASDVCKILELGDVYQTATRLDDDEWRFKNVTPTKTYNIRPTRGTNPILVSEPGLYRLIFTSRTPKAREFQNWVYHEVLPTIRKTGGYRATWQDKRNAGKIIRRNLTDTVQKFVEYLKVRVELDRPENVWYIIFSKLVNVKLGLADGRDNLNEIDLERVARAEDVVARVIEAGMTAGKSHHDIHEACKTQLSAWALFDDLSKLF